MHRAIVDTITLTSSELISLSPEESHHLRTVLRAKVGEQIVLQDGAGHSRLATISEIRKSEVICTVCGGVETLPRVSVAVTLFQCIAKPTRMDWLLEKAVEIGVDTLVPILSAQSVVRHSVGDKPDRWQRIAEAALRQCGGGWMMQIAPAIKWAQAIEKMRAFEGPILVGALTGEMRPLGDVLFEFREQGLKQPVGWVIGPEGDFSTSELADVLALPNAIPVSLGPNVLRVETAALYGISATLASVAQGL